MQPIDLNQFPSPPAGKTGWPWTPDTASSSLSKSALTDLPRVSIVIPSYNQARFLEAAIRSVLLQNYPDLELIIIDGGSIDGSVDLIKKYESWLTYWHSGKDRGQSHAINMGLEHCTGPWFNWVNSDDLLTPGSLHNAVDALLQHPDAGYVHGARIFIDDNDHVLKKDTFEQQNPIIRFPTPSQAVSVLQSGAQPGALMDTQRVRSLGGIRENLHYVMDVDILLRIAVLAAPVRTREYLSYVRIYPEIKSNQWNIDRARERLAIADHLFKCHEMPSGLQKCRHSAFAHAHRFAWDGALRAKNPLHFIRHFICDLYYDRFYRGWRDRLQRLRSFLNPS